MGCFEDFMEFREEVEKAKERRQKKMERPPANDPRTDEEN
jgi:hypothetical protein